MYQQAGKRKAKKYICNHCSGVFHSEDDLTNHKEKGCMAVEGQTIEMPKFDPREAWQILRQIQEPL